MLSETPEPIAELTRPDSTCPSPAPHFSPSNREAGSSRRGPARPAVIALIDAEFWRWWQDTPQATPERDVLISARQAIRDALTQTRDGMHLQRLLWVSETRVTGLDDARAVAVPSANADEGWPLVRALSQALFDVALGGIVHTVLLATDDDRLLPAIDEVQRRGLRVLMLQGDERKLSDEWRRLLASADRCLQVGEGRTARLRRHDRSDSDRPDRPERHRAGTSSPERSERWEGSARTERSEDLPLEPPSAEAQHLLEEAATQWWSGLDDAERQALREGLPQSRGLPRDLDRQLLIAAARGLDRQLSVPEKHALRAAARAMAGQGVELLPADHPV